MNNVQNTYNLSPYASSTVIICVLRNKQIYVQPKITGITADALSNTNDVPNGIFSGDAQCNCNLIPGHYLVVRQIS